MVESGHWVDQLVGTIVPGTSVGVDTMVNSQGVSLGLSVSLALDQVCQLRVAIASGQGDTIVVDNGGLDSRDNSLGHRLPRGPGVGGVGSDGAGHDGVGT